MNYTVEGNLAVTTDGELAETPKKTKAYVICDVCGYANKVTAALCSECSNYLFTERKEYVFEK